MHNNDVGISEVELDMVDIIDTALITVMILCYIIEEEQGVCFLDDYINFMFVTCNRDQVDALESLAEMSEAGLIRVVALRNKHRVAIVADEAGFEMRNKVALNIQVQRTGHINGGKLPQIARLVEHRNYVTRLDNWVKQQNSEMHYCTACRMKVSIDDTTHDLICRGS